MWHVWVRGETHKGIWWENLRDRDNLEDPDVNGRIILRWTFRKWDGRHSLTPSSKYRDILWHFLEYGHEFPPETRYYAQNVS
jgi:hypothetical protein